MIFSRKGTRGQRAARRRRRFLNRKGFVLISSYLVVAVLLVLQSAYLSRIVNDVHLASNHTDHVRSLQYADAGLDVALVNLAGNMNYLGTSKTTLGDGAYRVTITPHPTASDLRIVEAVGYYPSTATAYQERIQALVRVSAKLFNYGLFGDEEVKMVGSTAVQGGYNSNLGELPVPGTLGAPADLGTNGTELKNIWFTGSLFGPYTKAYCGQGTTLPGPNYCVKISGSANYLGAAVMTEASPLPAMVTPTPPYNPNGVIIAINGGTTTITTAHPNVFAPAGAPTDHYAMVVQGFSVSGNAQVNVDSGIARLSIYTLNNLSLTGSGSLGDTTTYAATKLIFYQQGSADVTIGGGGTIVAGIFAPNAEAQLTGGATVYGAVAAEEIDGNGSFTFYFDEGLKNLSTGQSGAAELVVWDRN